jgi:hypothetical protein
MTQRSGTGDRRSGSFLWRFFAEVLEKHMHDDFGEEAEYKYISQHKGLLFLLFFTVQAGEGVKAPQTGCQAPQAGNGGQAPQTAHAAQKSFATNSKSRKKAVSHL